ncbi:ParB/RepB/Spo0J family partition protein [Mesorhizobium sp. CU2]|uniref:ParB/RepB/Spo0J family partition protein n=1 Tax=unclassified Mesorhizobium TaxID=325217 RepID=UPI001127A610|nr:MULTISPECIES: ParB/RepB/Spo0J family partition protein [unclassified Mesorhizobium]TPN81151.1 ParB/RepB/Spo0J family partition protein [Mesorhizobium sp. CU3]TPO17050.1 ParB/RepB/Spo0J family partition protein [Mesorhizobium sp. CU2]
MAKAIQKITLDRSMDIPFDKLELSQKNVRNIKAGISIEDLANDIALRGLLMSLNVRPILGENDKETGRYEVPAGGRRYRALDLLIKQKRMAKTEPIPCIIKRGGSTSVEDDSLAENVHRLQLHPLDQFRAFQTLYLQGLGEEEIAARYFVSLSTVRQRLRLASVSPRLLDLYANDEIKLEQVMAFSITNDHVRQEQVWDTVSRSHVREPYYIRRLLTETAVRAVDRRAVYIGIEAYEAAGGVVMRDLFEQDQGGWLQDPALLEQLVFEKLKTDAEALKAEEGWNWVDAAIDFPYGHASGLRRFYGERPELSADELAQYDEAKAEYDKLDAEYAEATDYSEETETRLEELGNELDRLNDRPHVFDPEEVARGGAFISLGASGELKIERGFVRPQDEPIVEADGTGAGDHDGDHAVAASATGGISVNGKPVAVEPPEEEDDRIRPLSDRVVEDLTAARTIALRNALANDPVMAFVAALHVLVLKSFFVYGSDSCLEVTLQSAKFSQTQGLGDTVWAKEIEQRHEAWGHDLPKTPAELWAYLVALDEASRQALFAHCVSLSLNAVVQPWNRRPAAIAHADELARSIGFDMVEAGWTPMVDNYLGRVTKAHILQAVREAKGEQSAQLIDHLKKVDMACEAARLLEGSGWLPEPLRLTVDEALPEQGNEAADEVIADDAVEGADIDLPAYLTEGAEGEDTAHEDAGIEENRHLDAAE